MDLPLFHLYGDPPEPRAYNFVHAETIASRCLLHDWRIGVHRHANLLQILVIEHGTGEIQYEVSTAVFSAPAIIVVPPTVAHGFRFQSSTTGWVVSFTQDVARVFGDPLGGVIAYLKRMTDGPVIAVGDAGKIVRLSELCAHLSEERFLSREGFHVAMNSYLALIAVEVRRLVADRDPLTASHDDAVIDKLFKLIENNFRDHRLLNFYAARLAMSPDRLNKHIKRLAGVTAGQLIRQRVLTEAKRQLAFSDQPISEIAYDLAYSDPSHFVRCFRRDTGMTPRAFREQAARLT
ncbi:helix-turn-helix domain-containing protein [Bradyrhizobium diazoefficiens]|uniref:helix-turn-helix domain-containing protein n=1 Tax=Bradyrhizobium diazoefficiens TaxID=1355477 RepID=UPI00190914C7|nr:helix-turn-helix domain-containing protein [Bradyrhizobium diazoefficiens]MBK3660662.1 helix-turn-helix domain-containing protein [Bradyrhizobium diazoefficiens]